MKQPIWIVNSSLLFLFLVIVFILLLTRDTVPPRQPILPGVQPVIVTEKPKINMKKIYEYDLFDTYIVVPPTPVVSPYRFEVPPAPAIKPPVIPVIRPPQFLPPLDISLTGLLWKEDETKSKAVIVEIKSGQERGYKMGDMIDDGRVVRIFPNKVIIVRSNGQQEVLYLREADAKSDPMFVVRSQWFELVQELKPTVYSLDPRLFSERIKTLGQFIDMLDLTTVYKNGKSIGCRIGVVEKDSLATALGFIKGDVIVSIDNIPATTTESRFKIYQSLMTHYQEGRTFEVRYMRSGQHLATSIVLQEKKPKPSLESIKKLQTLPVTAEDVKEKEIKSLKDKYNFAPTLKEMRERERINMQQRAQPIKPSIVEKMYE